MKTKLMAALAVCVMTVTSFGYGVGGGGGGDCSGGCYNIYTYSGGNFTFSAQAQNTGSLGGLIVLNRETGAIVINQWNDTGIASNLTNSSGCIRGGQITPCYNENWFTPPLELELPVGSYVPPLWQLGVDANYAGNLVASQGAAAAVAHFNRLPAGLGKNLAGEMIAVRWARNDPNAAAIWVVSLPLNERNFALLGLEVGTQLFLARVGR